MSEDTTNMNEQDYREMVLGDRVGSYAPLNLDECMDVRGPIDPTKAKRVLGDVILCEVLDENQHGEVNRGGIFIKEDIGTRTWRRAKVWKTGSQCHDVEVGDVVVYPSDRGMRMIGSNHKKYLFLNESRIFYVEE